MTGPRFSLEQTLELIGKGLPVPKTPDDLPEGQTHLAELLGKVSHEVEERVGVLRDSSQRLRAERDRLEERLERADKELSRLRGEAKTSERMKYEFITNINHKLRTPLTSIIGFSSLLRQQYQEGEVDQLKAADYLKIIASEGERLLGMVETLIDLARINAGEFVAIPRFFNLNKRIEGEVPAWRAEAHQRGVELELAFDADLEGMNGDSDMILTLCGLLVSNAVAHSPRGSFVRLATRGEEDREVVIEVADSGEGIPAEKLDVIFQDFVQHHKPFGQGGLGLGLSLVRSIAWLHMGRVEVESEVGKGSLFRAILPAAWGAVATDARQSRPGTGGPDVPRLLVADDDTHSRRLLYGMLGGEYAILEAHDGQEAEEIARKFTPDLILMDLAMPDTDGLSAIRAIRREPHLREIPILAISARTDEEEVKLAYEAGADSFLKKPFTKAEVIEEVNRLLKERAGKSGPP